MTEGIKRWTAKRKSALVLEIIQSKTTISEASRQYDLTPSEIDEWIDNVNASMENALKASPKGVREQYERQLKSCKKPTAKRCWRYVHDKNCSPS